MSHVVKIETVIDDMQAAIETCKRLGWEFCKGQTTYKWYGRSVGDYPLPEGMTEADLGKCEHAIKVPGTTRGYEVGLVRQGNGFVPVFDFYDDGLKKAVGGVKCEKFYQHYAIEKAKAEARKAGLRRFTETTLPNGSIKLTVKG